jgi:hypothetical protein
MPSVHRTILALLALAFLAAGAPQATAQEPFGNPFAGADTLRKKRGGAPDATLRLRYDVTGDAEAEQAGELVIEVRPTGRSCAGPATGRSTTSGWAACSTSARAPSSRAT